MALPKVKKVCGFLPLDAGCIVVTILSFALCAAAMAVCAWKLPQHRRQRNEDNILLLSAAMFATLSAASHLTVLVGIALKRPSFLQLAQLSNGVFILCILLVSAVTCLFSPTVGPFLENPGNIALVVILLISSAVYSFYYLAVVNSKYTKMKMDYADSAIPV